MAQADERDVIFARMNYAPDTKEHQDYYARHPERLERDTELRQRDLMGDKDSTFYHPLLTPLPDACFNFLGDIKPLVSPPPAPTVQGCDPATMSQFLCDLARYYGAKEVAVVSTKDLHYTHKGRPLEIYGKEIDMTHPFGIVFAVEMAETLIDSGPNITESIATTKGYMDAAIIGMVLAYYIASLGYGARNHMDGNYEFPLPAVAQAGGLGEFGLHGLLITKGFGPRVRLGMVSTSMPLVPATPEPMGITEFCKLCQRCKRTCPGKAIDNPALGNQHGFCDTNCLAMWQKLGSDCGVCLSVCPFSHQLPPELTQDLTTPENRQALADYCDIHHPRRTFKLPPQWLQLPKE